MFWIHPPVVHSTNTWQVWDSVGKQSFLQFQNKSMSWVRCFAHSSSWSQRHQWSVVRKDENLSFLVESLQCFVTYIARDKRNLLLYEHQRNTRWVFVRKLDIFTFENNTLSSHVKISPLPWLHNKSRLPHQKTIKVKWFGISLVFI